MEWEHALWDYLTYLASHEEHHVEFIQLVAVAEVDPQQYWPFECAVPHCQTRKATRSLMNMHLLEEHYFASEEKSHVKGMLAHVFDLGQELRTLRDATSSFEEYITRATNINITDAMQQLVCPMLLCNHQSSEVQQMATHLREAHPALLDIWNRAVPAEKFFRED